MSDQYSLPAGASSPDQTSSSPEELRQQRRMLFWIGLIVILILALLVAGLYFLFTPATSAETVSRIRDVFIIVMALETLIIGVVLVILMLQLARLTNLLQHEIKPILKSTNETISTLRGTTEFLSENLTEPVIKINEYVAAIQKFLALVGIGRRTL